MKSDIELDLPEGWREVETKPDEPRCFTPDDESVLQISSPSWGDQVRDTNLEELQPLLRRIVEGGHLGTVDHVATVELAYGRALVAEVSSDDHGDCAAWLIVPERACEVLLVTWIASDYSETARELVAKLRPGMFSVVAAMAIELNSKVDQVWSHAVLVGDGKITQVQLESLPVELWTDACRHERARAGADFVAQVLAGRNARTQERVVSVYVESATRTRQVVIGANGDWENVPPETRKDFFVPADPRVAKALTEARQ